jgi:hypothetical protein
MGAALHVALSSCLHSVANIVLDFSFTDASDTIMMEFSSALFLQRPHTLQVCRIAQW